MKKIWDLKKVFCNLEPEGQGRGIIMRVTCLLLLGPFYTIQTNFMYFFAHDCMSVLSTTMFILIINLDLCTPEFITPKPTWHYCIMHIYLIDCLPCPSRMFHRFLARSQICLLWILKIWCNALVPPHNHIVYIDKYQSL